MKPHEMEWRRHGLKVATVINIEGTGETVCFVEAGSRDAAERLAEFIAAAPDMARALSDALAAMMKAQDVIDGVVAVPGLADAVEKAERALRKAGVIS